MEKANIGFKAGIILEKLGETGLITIAELARRLNLAADETALAAGWLARENKIYIERRNGLLYRNKPFRLIGASTYQLERYIPAWVLR